MFPFIHSFIHSFIPLSSGWISILICNGQTLVFKMPRPHNHRRPFLFSIQDWFHLSSLSFTLSYRLLRHAIIHTYIPNHQWILHPGASVSCLWVVSISTVYPSITWYSSMSEAKSLDWIVVPIAKFSHNSCPVGTRNFVWNHVSLREDMDIVFQTSRMVDDLGNLANRVVMKITAGAELLVCILQHF